MGYVVARALNCTLSPSTLFERKNYFYPDLPKNYQISQFRSPLGTDGWVEIELRKRKKRVRIREVHLEEDAGKMIHAGDITLLDYNRAGTPLLEIVTQPDLEVGEEAEIFLQQLRRTVRYLGVCDGNMEEGSLRCDANVSVNLEGKGLGSKVEVKNLNSFKFVRKAITFEIERQTEILERGGGVTLGNAAVEREPGRHGEHAHQGKLFRLPLLPGAGPAPVRARMRHSWPAWSPPWWSCRRRARTGSWSPTASPRSRPTSSAMRGRRPITSRRRSVSAPTPPARHCGSPRTSRSISTAPVSPWRRARSRRSGLPSSWSSSRRSGSTERSRSPYWRSSFRRTRTPLRSSGKRAGSRSRIPRSWRDTSRRSWPPTRPPSPRSVPETIGPSPT